jgi:hypothetical protein
MEKVKGIRHYVSVSLMRDCPSVRNLLLVPSRVRYGYRGRLKETIDEEGEDREKN